jgi:hypothetical protein
MESAYMAHDPYGVAYQYEPPNIQAYGSGGDPQEDWNIYDPHKIFCGGTTELIDEHSLYAFFSKWGGVEIIHCREGEFLSDTSPLNSAH